jgi:hypothetical protein
LKKAAKVTQSKRAMMTAMIAAARSKAFKSLYFYASAFAAFGGKQIP